MILSYCLISIPKFNLSTSSGTEFLQTKPLPNFKHIIGLVFSIFVSAVSNPIGLKPILTIIALFCLNSIALVNSCSQQNEQNPNGPFTTLVFSDEFNEDGPPNPDKWHHQIIPPNNGGWFNNELQHYTNRPINSNVINGKLVIRALREDYDVDGSIKHFTSARLNSKFKFTYGKVEVRAKLPEEAGTWPAIWTLGVDSNETGNYFGDRFGNVGWAECGEIDILEQTGGDKNSTISHFHWDDLTTKEYKNEGSTLTLPKSVDGFHIFSMEWTQKSIKTFVDGTLVYELPNSENKPFNHDHYLILNLAIGGTLGGEVPDTFSDADFIIDYVRIYQ